MPVPDPTTAGEAAVRAWCGWHVAPSATETIQVDSDGARVALLPSLLVTGISEVRDEDGAIVDASSYRWRKNGVVRGQWACGVLYEFDITHGYDEMPLELQDVIDKIDADGLEAGAAVQSRTVGPFSETYDLSSAPLSVKAVLDRYKLPPRP